MAAGRPFLTDFGLARDTATGSALTRTGVTLGTPAYMSPELARGEFAALTPASDVWALGCVLHELLTGRAPFGRTGTAEIIGRIVTEPPPSLRAANPGLPAGVRRLAESCLRRAPGARYRDAGAVRADAARVLSGAGARGTAAPRRVGVLVAAAIVTAAALVGAVAWRPSREPVPPTPAGPDAVAPLVEQAARRRPADPVGAALLLAGAIAQRPGDRALRHAQAECWREAGRFGDSLALYDALVASDSGDVRARFGRGFTGYLSREARRAQGGVILDDLRAATGLPGWEGALARALLHCERRAWAEAEAELAGHVQRWEPRLALAMALHHRHDATADTQRRAIQEMTAVLAQAPPVAWILDERGHAHALLGDWASAAADYARATAIDPGDRVAWTSLVACLAERGDAAAQRDAIDRALVALPGDPSILHARALVREAAGDLDGAEADLDAVLAADPGFAEAWLNRSEIRQQRGRLRDALADLTEAVTRFPRFLPAWVNRADVWNDLGEPERALADCEAALALRPDDGLAFLQRGRAWDRLAQPAKAEADFGRAIELRPGDGTGWYNRGSLRLEQRRPAEAEPDFTRALERDPRYVKAWVNRAAARGALGRADEALADVREARRLDPDFPPACYYLGRTQLLRGERAEAVAAFDEFLRRWPDHPWAPAARDQREAAAGR